MPTKTSRSAIVTRKLCEMKRYNNYHRVLPDSPGGTTPGIVPLVPVTPKSLIPKLRGAILHEVAERLFKQEPWVEWLEQECLKFDPTVRAEQHALIRRAMLGWAQVRGELLSHYTVVSAEAEWTWTMSPEVALSLRMDRILRSTADGTLAVLDFKTMKAPDRNWITRMGNSEQTHLYLQALKERTGEFVSGMIYEGIIVGALTEDCQQRSPFVMAWQNRDGTFSPRYASGKPTVSTLGWSDEQWLQWATESGILGELYTTTGPLLPPDDVLLATKHRTAAAEERWNQSIALVAEVAHLFGVDSPEHLAAVEQRFEQSAEACLKFGYEYACGYTALCWGGATPDNESFTPREDHHA